MDKKNKYNTYTTIYKQKDETYINCDKHVVIIEFELSSILVLKL